MIKITRVTVRPNVSAEIYTASDEHKADVQAYINSNLLKREYTNLPDGLTSKMVWEWANAEALDEYKSLPLTISTDAARAAYNALHNHIVTETIETI
jgi:hypothetical protein